MLGWFPPYVDVSQPQAYVPSRLPPHPTALGRLGALGFCVLCQTADFRWLSILRLVMYMFQ